MNRLGGRLCHRPIIFTGCALEPGRPKHQKVGGGLVNDRVSQKDVNQILEIMSEKADVVVESKIVDRTKFL